MTNSIRLFLLCSLLAPMFALKAQPLIVDPPQHRNVRGTVILDPEAKRNGDPVLGFLVGFSQQIYPIDQMVISFGHLSSSDFEQNYVLLSFEEHFPISETVAPYGSTGFGFMWTDDKRGDADREGLFGQIAAGIIVQTSRHWAFFGEVNYMIGTSRMWLDHDKLVNRNLQFQAGFRYSF